MNSSLPIRLRTIIIVLIIVGLMLLALSGYLNTLTRMAMNPLIAAQSWLASRYQVIRDFFTAPRDLISLQQSNAVLEAEIARLQTQIIELQQLTTEVQIYTALLDLARSHPEYQYLAARVIALDPSPFLHYVIIDKGSDHGLRRGMPIVTSQGLVGRVSAVLAGAARVQLITDPASSVNVRLQPSEVDATLQGSLTGDLSLELIPQDVEVLPGNLILTSGLGGNYPPSILIGQVSSVRQRATDLFQSASVQPAVDFSRASIILVITNFRPVDISPLLLDRESAP